jgi:hypothetical protein
MNGGSDTLVFWILVPLFLAVGLYLIWYSRRRRKMLESFARKQHLRIRPDHRQELENTLERCFSLEQPGLVRNFGQLSSLVDGGAVWIFRAVELLDLDPHGQPPSTHFNRIAAFFPVPEQVHTEFFMLDKNMQEHGMLPGQSPPDPEVVAMSRETARDCHARHALSVTLARGHGLIYFEPFVVGGETINDVNSLYCIAKSMHEKLSGNI